MNVDRSAFVDLCAGDDPAGDDPVVAYASARVDTGTSPLAAYAALADGEHSFLLESASKTAASDPDGAFQHETEDRHARYSFVGYDPDALVTVNPDGADVEGLAGTGAAAHVDPERGDDVLDTLRTALPDAERRGFPDADRQLLDGGLVGFLAYDAVYDLWLDEVGVERPETPLPDAQFVLNTKTLVFDQDTDEVSLVFTPVVGPDDDPGAVYDALAAEAERVRDVLADASEPETGGFRKTGERAGSRDDYARAVERAKEAVLDGEIYQGVVSRTRELRGEVDPLGLYESLRDVNPSPYMYVVRTGERTVIGASPETLVSVRGRTVLNNPIAGTCPRGSSPVEDRRLAGEMLADEKERAEHTMLVDLSRNDVRRVSEAGSVQVPEFMRVLKYSHVQHIESTVTGTLAPEYDAFDAVRASFPAGTLSGAPKVRAMELIHELEAGPRGVYGGGVGYVSWTGDADFAIVIRTATVSHGERSSPERANADRREHADHRAAERANADRREHDTVRVRAGAGVVADSDPDAEFEETEKKMGGVLDALAAITEDPVEVSR